MVSRGIDARGSTAWRSIARWWQINDLDGLIGRPTLHEPHHPARLQALVAATDAVVFQESARSDAVNLGDAADGFGLADSVKGYHRLLVFLGQIIDITGNQRITTSQIIVLQKARSPDLGGFGQIGRLVAGPGLNAGQAVDFVENRVVAAFELNAGFAQNGKADVVVGEIGGGVIPRN